MALTRRSEPHKHIHCRRSRGSPIGRRLTRTMFDGRSKNHPAEDILKDLVC